jgi:hypothetical protein
MYPFARESMFLNFFCTINNNVPKKISILTFNTQIKIGLKYGSFDFYVYYGLF